MKLSQRLDTLGSFGNAGLKYLMTSANRHKLYL